MLTRAKIIQIIKNEKPHLADEYNVKKSVSSVHLPRAGRQARVILILL